MSREEVEIEEDEAYDFYDLEAWDHAPPNATPRDLKSITSKGYPRGSGTSTEAAFSAFVRRNA